MARIEFHVATGTHGSTRSSGVIDTVKDFNMEEGEWESMSEDERAKVTEEVMQEVIDMWYSVHD